LIFWHALHRLWAYLALGVSSVLTEEAAPLIGGLAAHDRKLGVVSVGTWIAAGSWSGDIVLYYLGRWRSQWLRRRWPKLRAFVLRTFKVVRRHPWRASLAVRFAYGLRFTLPIACGAARVPLTVYLIGSAISAVVWAFLFTAAGWWFGQAMLSVLGHVRRYEQPLFALIVVVLAIVFWIMHKRHVEDETVHVLSRGDAPDDLPPAEEF
jgi:membrane protein DedA with SNARE-associated domain